MADGAVDEAEEAAAAAAAAKSELFAIKAAEVESGNRAALGVGGSTTTLSGKSDMIRLLCVT